MCCPVVRHNHLDSIINDCATAPILERWRKNINVIRYNSKICISLFSLKCRTKETKCKAINLVHLKMVLSQCQYWILNKLVYNWMVNGSISNRCNCRNFIASIFR